MSLAPVKAAPRSPPPAQPSPPASVPPAKKESAPPQHFGSDEIDGEDEFQDYSYKDQDEEDDPAYVTYVGPQKPAASPKAKPRPIVAQQQLQAQDAQRKAPSAAVPPTAAVAPRPSTPRRQAPPVVEDTVVLEAEVRRCAVTFLIWRVTGRATSQGRRPESEAESTGHSRSGERGGHRGLGG